MNIALDWLPDAAFAYLVVFARVGVLLMLMPALGSSMVPARLRLSFALLMSLVLYPLVRPELPAMPADVLALAVPLGHELAIGFILGGIVRMVIAATQAAGATIAFQTGLSFANSPDPTLGGQQDAVISSFLSVLAVTLVFATDLHHLALAAIYDSYKFFPPDAPLMLGDAAKGALMALAESFRIGVQMAAPFIVFGLVFSLGLGILSRLMPQLQVYFIAMPASIGLGLALFALLITMMMGLYLSHFEAQLSLLRG